jgi:Ca2+-binding RTX toxin-like protein
MVLSRTATFSGNTPIPDLGTISQTLNLLGGDLGLAIVDIRVSFSITHTFDSDLDIYLIAPNGRVIELSTDNGGPGDNYANTNIFQNNGYGSIADANAPFTGTFRPEGDLTVAYTSGVSGNWTLRVDDDGLGDVGTLTFFKIDVDYYDTGHLPFLGQGGADIADAATGQLVGFSNASLALLQDAVGDQIWGRSGNDRIVGGSGNDYIYGDNGNDTLIGGAGTDFVYGQDDADTLWGSYGDDTSIDYLFGGDGNDTYVRQALNDVVTETNADPLTGGYDLIYSSSDYTLGANEEYLYYFGGNFIGGITGGNSLDNIISAINYYGGSGLFITANEGSDIVYGSYYGDQIYGGSGADTLWGSWGADSAADNMYGGAANDIYVVQESQDAVIETDTSLVGGLDLVYSGINYTLGANVEYLQIYGNATTGTGNELANLVAASYSGQNCTLYGLGGADQLVGGGGNDRLDGGAQADTLIGSTGNDIFVFARGELDGDVITDFNGNGAAVGDSLQFVGFGAGAFFVPTAATQGRVYYNGLGGGLVFETVTFSNSATINAQDYTFV